MIALIGITIERKVRSSSRKAKPSTNANTIGARELHRLVEVDVGCGGAGNGLLGSGGQCRQHGWDHLCAQGLERLDRRRVLTFAGEREVDARDRLRLVDGDANRLVDHTGRERALLELLIGRRRTAVS